MTMWHGGSLVERQYTETLQIANIEPRGSLKPWFWQGFRGQERCATNQVPDGFLALQHDFAAQQPVLRGVCRLARKEFVRAPKKYRTG